MGFLAIGLQSIAGLASLVCLILVLVKVFQAGETTVGVILVLLLLCFGIGVLITFIYGWIKAKPWNITNIMIIWSIAWVVGIVGGVLSPNPFAAAPGP